MNRSGRLLHRYAVLTAVATFALLIVGSLVTSTDSGLAVPDWPLSYGTWFPPMVGGIFYEHGHRVIAGLVAILMLILTVWTARTESRRWVRWLGYGALAAVILQALLGGLTVLLLLPPQVSIAHACLGQAVFCLVVSLAWCTSPRASEVERCHTTIVPPSTLTKDAAPLCGAVFQPFSRAVHAAREDPAEGEVVSPRGGTSEGEPSGFPSELTRLLSVVIVGMAFLQLLLGAMIRHTGYAVSPHIIGALLLGLSSGWLVRRTRRFRETDPMLSMHVRRLFGLLCAQVILGIVVLGHRGAVMPRTAHVAMGALVLAQAVVVVWETMRSCDTTSVSVKETAPVAAHG